MDTNIFSKIPECGSCPDLTGFSLVVGVKQLKKALARGTARYVFLAEDADPGLTEPIAAECMARGVGVTRIRSMSELGRSCGIEVGAAAAAVVREPRF